MVRTAVSVHGGAGAKAHALAQSTQTCLTSLGDDGSSCQPTHASLERTAHAAHAQSSARAAARGRCDARARGAHRVRGGRAPRARGGAHRVRVGLDALIVDDAQHLAPARAAHRVAAERVEVQPRRERGRDLRRRHDRRERQPIADALRLPRARSGAYHLRGGYGPRKVCRSGAHREGAARSRRWAVVRCVGKGIGTDD
jgi:hypothetical protein